jgi:hypothetical protein
MSAGVSPAERSATSGRSRTRRPIAVELKLPAMDTWNVTQFIRGTLWPAKP